MDVRTLTHSETVCNLLSADKHTHTTGNTHCSLREREKDVTGVNKLQDYTGQRI